MKKAILFFFALLLIVLGFYFFKNKNSDFKKITQVLENEKNLFLNKENNSPKQENSQDVYQSVSEGLDIEIIEPQNNITVNSQNLKIKGKTSPNIEVFVNEKELISNEKGEFQADLILDEGENIITIVASDKQGNYAEKEIVVNFETLN